MNKEKEVKLSHPATAQRCSFLNKRKIKYSSELTIKSQFGDKKPGSS